MVNFNGGEGAVNYGLVVKLSGSYEDGGFGKSYYTKKFFARSSHHYFEKPIISPFLNTSISINFRSVSSLEIEVLKILRVNIITVMKIFFIKVSL